MKKLDQKVVELTDEIYQALLDEHGKIAVIKVEDDVYAVRYPSKIEFKAITSAQSKPVTQALTAVEQVVSGMIVWPESEIVLERAELDGGLITIITSQFINFYMNRSAVEEKKR